jgi:hypothetical protein
MRNSDRTRRANTDFTLRAFNPQGDGASLVLGLSLSPQAGFPTPRVNAVGRGSVPE